MAFSHHRSWMNPNIFLALTINETDTSPKYPEHNFRDPLVQNFLLTLPPILSLLFPVLILPKSKIVSTAAHGAALILHIWQIADSVFRRLTMPRLYPSALRNYFSGQILHSARASLGFLSHTGPLTYFFLVYLAMALGVRWGLLKAMRRARASRVGRRAIHTAFRAVIILPVTFLALCGCVVLSCVLLYRIRRYHRYYHFPILVSTLIWSFMTPIEQPPDAEKQLAVLQGMLGLENGSRWTGDPLYPLEHTVSPAWDIYPQEDSDGEGWERPAVLIYLVESLPADRLPMVEEEMRATAEAADLTVTFPKVLAPSRPTLLSAKGCFQGFLGHLQRTEWPVMHPQGLGCVGGDRVWMASAIDKHLDGSLGYFKKPAAGYDQEKINLRSTFHLPYYANDREALRHTLPLLEEEAFVVGWTRSSHVPVDVPTGEWCARGGSHRWSTRCPPPAR
eukprot:gnl/Dysnectes_brevis/4494_a6060_361.p1 GENE.gnl/Dysnectes_brevis/4494_a6060_361~~gnl/Dysnectes_brevis/4494_a6060_361.p1  ORF type:complete len:480 (-),score=131.99 gnl/Dysnectes_brevis/4494_a6060_361:784-2130(-)